MAARPPSLIIYNEKDKGSDLNNCPSVAVAAAAAAAAKCLSVFPSLNERGRRKTYARPPERARCPLVRAGALSKRTVIVILGNGFCKARRVESRDGGEREGVRMERGKGRSEGGVKRAATATDVYYRYDHMTETKGTMTQRGAVEAEAEAAAASSARWFRLAPSVPLPSIDQACLPASLSPCRPAVLRFPAISDTRIKIHPLPSSIHRSRPRDRYPVSTLTR